MNRMSNYRFGRQMGGFGRFGRPNRFFGGFGLPFITGALIGSALRPNYYYPYPYYQPYPYYPPYYPYY